MKDATVRRLVAMTVASAPSSCGVCGGERWMRAAWDAALGLGACPHCVLGLPIAHLPMRVDHPREESA